MVSNTMEDIEINVDDSMELTPNKRRKLDNGNSSSDKEDSELQVVDEDIDVSGPEPAPTFIEEVMDEGGGDIDPTSIQEETPATPSTPSVPVQVVEPVLPKPQVEPTVSSSELTPSVTSVTTASTAPNKVNDETSSGSVTTTTSAYLNSVTGRSNPAPPNVTAIPLMMQSIASVGTVPSPMIRSTLASMMSPQPPSLSSHHPTLPSPTPVSNLSDPSSVVRNLMNSVSAVGNMNSTVANNMAGSMPNNMSYNMPNNMPNNMQNNMSSSILNMGASLPNSFQTSQNSGTSPAPGGVSNPVGMTAHALLETLLAQVIAHSMNGNAPNPALPTAGIPSSAPTTPTHPCNPCVSVPDVSGPKPDQQNQQQQQQQQPAFVTPVPTSLQDTPKPLKETLDKINMLEQNTVSLDKQSAGIQRMVTEVVKKQEENTSAAGMLCPRCKHMVGGGEQFISHLIAVHNFVEQKGPVEKADFGSQAGLGTCRGWRYIRTKNSGTQSTLSMLNKGDSKQVIDLTNKNKNNTSPPPDQIKSGVVPAPSPNHPVPPNQGNVPSPGSAPALQNLSPSTRTSVGYDSARATAANILSFVFSNPDINKQFTDYAEIPKEAQHPPLRSPKKQQPIPPNYSHMPFLQTINKQLQQHNGLALFDKWNEVKTVSPISVSAQQEFMANALKQQQQMQAQQQAQHLQQQQIQQHQLQQAAHKRAVMQSGGPNQMMHQVTSMMQPIQPIQPTPIQASSLQQIRPHGSNFPLPPPMISVGELKDQYKQMISGHGPGGAAINAFDENSDSPLKDCLPKVRASLVNGDIQLMWNIIGDERKCTGYRLFAYMGATAPPISSTWTEVGTVKALPMPMAVTLSQFSKGCSYHFTVRAIDSQGNVGPFSEPCSIKLSF
ncbi:hypothetical protein ACHWQZ_G014554 [Mnemiopsis leidyi]